MIPKWVNKAPTLCHPMYPLQKPGVQIPKPPIQTTSQGQPDWFPLVGQKALTNFPEGVEKRAAKDIRRSAVQKHRTPATWSVFLVVFAAPGHWPGLLSQQPQEDKEAVRDVVAHGFQARLTKGLVPWKRRKGFENAMASPSLRGRKVAAPSQQKGRPDPEPVATSPPARPPPRPPRRMTGRTPLTQTMSIPG